LEAVTQELPQLTIEEVRQWQAEVEEVMRCPQLQDYFDSEVSLLSKLTNEQLAAYKDEFLKDNKFQDRSQQSINPEPLQNNVRESLERFDSKVHEFPNYQIFDNNVQESPDLLHNEILDYVESDIQAMFLKPRNPEAEQQIRNLEALNPYHKQYTNFEDAWLLTLDELLASPPIPYGQFEKLKDELEELKEAHRALYQKLCQMFQTFAGDGDKNGSIKVDKETLYEVRVLVIYFRAILNKLAEHQENFDEAQSLDSMYWPLDDFADYSQERKWVRLLKCV
jgi:hypothetical protein